MIETWKDISGFNGMYQISNLARIKTFQPRYKTPRILKPGLATMGYLTVCLKMPDGNRRSHYIHKLFALAYVANPENKKWINHKDGNKLNNTIENLEWVTPGENNSHAIQTGLRKSVHPARGVIQYDLQGNELGRFHSSEHVPGCSSGSICKCCNNPKYTHRGFRFAYIR